MTPLEVTELIGIPYSDTGMLPEDGFNCWGLLLYVQSRYFGRQLPTIPLGDADKTLAIHHESIHNGSYALVLSPLHGDAVLLRGGNCPHVGVWLEIDGGGVLHSLGGVGVVFTPKHRLNSMGYSRLVFYRVRDARSIYSTERPVPTDNQP
jgi:hypothetical protein